MLKRASILPMLLLVGAAIGCSTSKPADIIPATGSWF
jgi:hypothetical protein